MMEWPQSAAAFTVHAQINIV